MIIAVDISMYPLQQDYEQPILNFIARLKPDPSIEVVTNRMSTQLIGPMEKVWPIIQSAMKDTFENGSKTALVFKVINSDLSSVIIPE